MTLKFKNAVLLFNKGQIKKAEKICIELFKDNPKNIDNLNLLGIILFKKKDFDKSIKLIKESISINPNQHETNNNLGLIYIEIGKFKDAIIYLNNSIKINPNFTDAYNNLGIAFKELGQFNNAIKNWEKAISINPNNPNSYNNIGNILLEIKKEKLAIEYYKKALSINNKFTLAYFNLGNAYQKLKLFDASIDSYNKAIEINSGFAEAYYNRGNSYRDKNNLTKALEDYCVAYKINPDLENLFGNIFLTKNYLCEWNDYKSNFEYLIKGITNNKKIIDPFALLSIIDSPELQLKNTKNHISNKSNSKTKLLKNFDKRKNNKKIKLGYFSSDFKIHPVSHLITGVFEKHDKSQFELFAFSLTPPENDFVTERIMSAFDHFIDVSTKTEDEIAELSNNLNIDIAIDLMGFTKYNKFKIFLKKCSPIQINYLGYSSSYGSGSMDYIIADKIVIPKENINKYSEKIIYLPNCFIPTDFKNIKLNNNVKRKDFNLPDEAFVFCSFNKQYKINPEIFNIWMNLLEKIENSVLWLKVTNTEAKKNIIHEAKKRSVNTNKIIFAQNTSLEIHLSRYKLADLFLDTFPYGAHTTCVDSLWSGLPVITKQGKSMVSRVSSSLLKNIGLDELITQTNSEYENLAFNLASNPKKIKSIKEKLNNNLNKMPLFNTNIYTQNFETALKVIYENNKKKLKNKNIEI